MCLRMCVCTYVCSYVCVYKYVTSYVCGMHIIQVDSEFAAGRYEEARRASEFAKNINYVGIVIGFCLFIIGVVIIIIDVAMAVAAA